MILLFRMKTKLAAIAPAVFLLVTQMAIARMMSWAMWAARRHWNEVLGPGMPLPVLSSAALDFGLVIPAAVSIAGQGEHHRKVSFAEELQRVLEKNGVSYDSTYLL